MSSSRSINVFQSFVNKLALCDIHPSGPWFTWTNRQTREVKSRLDRFLVSPSWLTTFPRSFAQNLSDNGSDHRAILLSDSPNHNGPKKYFTFDNRWLSLKEPNKIVLDFWPNTFPTGSLSFQFYDKLKGLCHCLW
ncbi:hypothetical protein LINGRAPRIM_LOCUS333 [Linum grandiflorum]